MLAQQRFSGKIVALMAADMLLGNEQRWHGLSANGTAAFLHGGLAPRMLVLSRMELDDSESCCTMNLSYVCHDMVVFRSPLHVNVRLDLFNFQQNIWQGENYAVGLLRSGGYELFNPCFDLPLFHNHISGQRPNQNENRLFRLLVRTCCVFSFLLPCSHSSTFLCSILEIRLKDWYCSACLPQKSLELQCLERLDRDWGVCFRGNFPDS
jgi:hypothetical protein